MNDYRTFEDQALMSRMEALASREREAIADSLACLAEVDRRKSYTAFGYSDTFDYCVRGLRYSIGSAYRRIHSARAADARRELYDDLRQGTLSLCVLALISEELKGSSADEVLAAARGKSKRDMAAWLFARHAPEVPRPDRVTARPPAFIALARAIEPPRPAIEPGHPVPAAAAGVSIPDAPIVETASTYEYSFIASADLHAAIERLKDLLWSKIPFGRLDGVLMEAVTDYIKRHDLSLALQAPARPARTESRRVSARVKNIVWARDGGRCVFTAPDGRRCASRRGLELDHEIPYSTGGSSVDPSNIRLLCREHNQLERRRLLGEGGQWRPAI